MVLSKRSLGFAIGLVWGLTVMLGTWWLLFWGSPGDTISKICAYYPGYSFTIVGGIIGLFWGFIDGFICGFLIALFYNMASKWFVKKS